MPFYTDDGEEVDPSKVPIPYLCLGCSKFERESEYILCVLCRMDQDEGKEFKCYAFEPKVDI
jgi:hypothetical protein